MLHSQPKSEDHSALPVKRESRTEDSRMIAFVMEAMKEYKAITIKIAEELGFEHREEPTAKEVKAYLLDIPMDPDDYALLHKIGGKLTLCRVIFDNLSEAVSTSPIQMDEAAELASYAYDVCGV